jgi:hypothetical protein
LKSMRAIRAYRQNRHATFLKFGIILAQLRQMLSAVRSHKSACQDEHHRLLAAKTRKTHQTATRIF